MMVPRSTMEKDLKSQERALTDDISSLGKKVSSPLLTAEFIESHTRSPGQIFGEAVQ
jgi:hypothetical protein